MVQINDDYYEDLTPENFARLLDDLAAGRPVTKGSQTGRVASEPEGGKLTSLTTLYGVDGRARRVRRPTRMRPRMSIPPLRPTPPPKRAHVKTILATLPKDATPEQKADAVGSRPAALAAPRADKGDDLQRIKGIGPVNQKRVHELGIYHFDQIAAWTREEILAGSGPICRFPDASTGNNGSARRPISAAAGAGPKDEGAQAPANV